jgi:hypothetical protein
MCELKSMGEKDAAKSLTPEEQQAQAVQKQLLKPLKAKSKMCKAKIIFNPRLMWLSTSPRKRSACLISVIPVPMPQRLLSRVTPLFTFNGAKIYHRALAAGGGRHYYRPDYQGELSAGMEPFTRGSEIADTPCQPGVCVAMEMDLSISSNNKSYQGKVSGSMACKEPDIASAVNLLAVRIATAVVRSTQ